MKKNKKSNKMLWIFLTILAYSLALVAWQLADFSNMPMLHVIGIAGEPGEVVILWNNAGSFLALMLAPALILLVKCFVQTYPTYKNNRKSNLVKATLIIEIISIIILLVGAFSFFMHKHEIMMPLTREIKPIEIYIPIYVFTNLSFGLIVADTALNAVSWAKK